MQALVQVKVLMHFRFAMCISQILQHTHYT